MIERYLFFRRRREIRKLESKHVLETSSVGDIAFLLLIFFIVTSSFILRQGIFLSLPSKTASSVTVSANKIMELVPGTRNYSLDGKQYTRESLVGFLSQRSRAEKDLVLVISMDTELAYERLVDSVSVARESGVTKISLKNRGD